MTERQYRIKQLLINAKDHHADENHLILIPKKLSKKVYAYGAMKYDLELILDEAHMDWILQLATRLRANGVNVFLDRWNLSLGKDLGSFMEKGLSKSHRVICVCSEKYVEKANEGIGGSGYEKQILTSALIKNQNTNYVIPLIKNNTTEEKAPLFLSGRVYMKNCLEIY